MPYTRDFIYGKEACAQRAERHKSKLDAATLAAGAGYGTHVVVLEIRTGEYEELDADDYAHGMRLAEQWVTRFGEAQTANVVAASPDGKLANSGTIVWDAPDMEG